MACLIKCAIQSIVLSAKQLLVSRSQRRARCGWKITV